MLKRLTVLIVSTCALASTFVVAGIEGTWQGNLVTAPGSELTVQFVIETKADGTYAALLNSPDSGAIKNVPASKVEFADNILNIEVDDLEGSFTGKLEDGTLKGNWKQLGESFPFELTPFKEKQLSAELIGKVAGRWTGSLSIPGGNSLAIVMKFDSGDAGKLTGTMESPDQSPRKFPMESLLVNDTDVSFNVDTIRGRYEGSFADGKIVGIWSQGQDFELVLTRAEFDPREYALDLSEEDAAMLEGSWWGEISTPIGPVPAILRFVQNDGDFMLGYFDSPDRGSRDTPLKTFNISDGVVEMTMAAGGFNGTIEGGKITGDFRQGGQKLPLTLQKGEMPPLLLDLAADSAAALLGSWRGTLKTPQGTSTIIFRFEKQGGGTVGYIDNTDGGMTGARIKSASLTDGQVIIDSSALLRLQYTGTLGDGLIEGQLQAGGRSFDVTVARD